mgnify:CR=1 FL=1
MSTTFKTGPLWLADTYVEQYLMQIQNLASNLTSEVAFQSTRDLKNETFIECLNSPPNSKVIIEGNFEFFLLHFSDKMQCFHHSKVIEITYQVFT